MHSCEFVFRINGNSEYVCKLYIYSALVLNQEEFSLSHPLVTERHYSWSALRSGLYAQIGKTYLWSLVPLDIAVSFILIKIGRPFPEMAIIPGLKRSLDHDLRKKFT